MTLADKKRQLKELGMPAMTPQEERDFQTNLTDTAAVDARRSEIGSVKTTMKGAKVVNGAYKGLTPAQAGQAAMTGTMPPGKFRPGAMGRMSGSLTGDSLYGPRRLTPPPAPTAAPTAAPAPVSKSPAQPSPSPQVSQPSAIQSLTTVPALGARPPLATARNAPAPRPQGLINGQPSSQYFQEAANRQGIANSYGTVKPQMAISAPASSPVSPSPAQPSPSLRVPAVDTLTPLIQDTQKMLDKARSPAPALTVPAPITASSAAPPPVQPRIAPFGTMPKMLASSTPTARPAKTLQPSQLVMGGR